ncbi:MAG: DHA2 family efflux MFS transporter permease subunit [Nakamurella sp.]
MSGAVARISPKTAVAAVFVAAMFINIIDATVVNVALPTIAAELGVPVELTATVNIGFLVAVAVAIPVAGWLGDRFGAREIFLFALGLFTAASLACGLAQTVEQLVLFRIVQGIGGGLMTPVGMSMLYRSFPPAERVRLSKLINIPIALAPAIGPVLGGLLVQKASWRWIFGINIPIGVLAIVFTLIAVPTMAKRTASSLDVPGFVLASVGFASLMFAVSEGATRGWGSPSIWIPGLLGAILLTLLVVVEGRVAAPMLRLQLFSLRLFRSANLVTFASAAGFLGGLFVYPLMLQTAFGYAPLTAGLMTFPEAIGIMIGTQIAARLYPRVGPRRLVAAGQAAVAVALLTLAFVMSSSIPTVVPVCLMLLLGFGQAHTFMPTQASAFDTVAPEHTGAATALYNATRQVGSAVGVAVAATIIATIGVHFVAGDPNSAIPPFRWALVGCALFSVAGSLIAAITIRDADAAPSRGLAPIVRTTGPQPAAGPVQGGRQVPVSAAEPVTGARNDPRVQGNEPVADAIAGPAGAPLHPAGPDRTN